MTKQPFPKPTPEEKIKLALLKIKLSELEPKFNLFVYMQRVNKIKSYYPPIGSIITIAETAIKNKKSRLWGYFNRALANEFPKEFANLNINEGEKFKNEPANMPQRLRDIFNKRG